MEDNSKKLREQAKNELRNGKKIDTSLYKSDLKVLVEELSIYQIELEHQNQELIQSQEYLQQSKDRYLDLFDNAPVGYLIVDSYGIIKDINRTACLMLESSKQEFLDNKISKIIHPDFQDVYYLYFRTLINQKHNQPCDIKLRKANNSFFYGRIQGVRQTQDINSDPEFRLAISDISIQKEMEIKLLAAKALTEQSEEQHRTILQTTMDGYWMTNFDGKFIEVNDAYCNMSGYTHSELLNMSVSDVEVVESRVDTDIHIKNLIINRSDRFVSKHRRKDGSVYDVEISAVYNPEYKNAFVVFLRDITEQKQSEIALKESELRFKVLFEDAPDAMLLANPETGKIIFANNKACSLFKKQKHELVGLFQYELHPLQNEDISKETFKEQFENTIQNQNIEPIENKICCSDGTEIPVEIVGKAINLDGELLMLGTFRDITVRKKVEEELKESEEKLSTLFNSMTEMVVMHELVYDDKGEAIDYRILDCNKTFTSITGIQKENAIGRLATDIYGTEEAPYLKEYANVALNRKTFEFNTYYAPMDKYFLISAVYTGNNRFSTISTDITSNEIIHEIIREKNKELENYIYVASHDLRSPLVNIQGFSQRLQKQTIQLTKIVTELNSGTDTVAEFEKIATNDIPKSINFIINNVSKMDTLINGLLQVSRTGWVVMNPAILDMNKLFKTILSIFDFQLKENDANVILNELDCCYGDADQLNQLFSNIIGNAIKYRDKQRKLSIEISSQMKHQKVIYSIKDNGIGINQRHLQKIWDVFYRVDSTASEAGEGLGLSLVKRIVEKHKGRIWAESVEGEGSTFYIEFHSNKFEV